MTNVVVYGTESVNGIFPSGYYTSEQRGSHEHQHLAMYFHGTDESEVEGLNFCYWEDSFPETDSCYSL